MDSQTSLASSDQTFANQYNHERSHSRRSVDWRDSGIVIDDDHQFYSIDTISHDLSKPINLSLSLQKEQQQRLQEQHHNSVAFTNSNSSCSSRGSILTPQSSNNSFALDHDDDGDTILHLAVVGCTVSKVRDLIRVCDLNAINNMMQTPLHVAVMASRPEMVELLIASGSRLDVHDRRGNTPLHLACQKGYIDIVMLLLDALSKPRNHMSNYGGQQATTTIKQQLSTTNFDGLTPLHLCAIEDRRDIIKLLVKNYDADLNCQDSRSGETIVHKAIKKLNPELVAFILSLDKHCNRADYSGRRPMDTIKILQNSKVDKNQVETLNLIEQLVLNRVKSCMKSNIGCCHPEQIDRLNNQILESSSSSSDYSDSDFEMS